MKRLQFQLSIGAKGRNTDRPIIRILERANSHENGNPLAREPGGSPDPSYRVVKRCFGDEEAWDSTLFLSLRRLVGSRASNNKLVYYWAEAKLWNAILRRYGGTID